MRSSATLASWCVNSIRHDWRLRGGTDMALIRTQRPVPAGGDATGVIGTVTALHDIPHGAVGSTQEISACRAMIEVHASLGLRSVVAESLPIAEAIEQGTGDLARLFANGVAGRCATWQLYDAAGGAGAPPSWRAIHSGGSHSVRITATRC
jgi:hypothetical protein